MVFAVAATVVAIVAGVIVTDTPRHGRDRHALRRLVPEHAARALGPPTARPARPRPGVRVSSAGATRVARRFASSWRVWDSGRRSRRGAAALRRLSVAPLWHRLLHQRARPTAAHPPTSLALHPVHAITSGRGRWRAALVARRPDNSYVGTLVIVATTAGPRVADIQW